MANRTTFTSPATDPVSSIRLKSSGITTSATTILNQTTVATKVTPNVVIKPPVIMKPPVITKPPVVTKDGWNFPKTGPVKISPAKGKDSQWWANLQMAKAVSLNYQLVQFTGYLPRESVKAPIAPDVKMSDAVLFEAPENPAVKYYLPRYRTAVHRISGRQQFRIALEQFKDKAGGHLTVYLEKYPAQEIENQVINAKEMPHQVEVSLVYLVQSANVGSIKKQLNFQEITLNDNGIKAVLQVPDLNELTQVYQALSDEDFQARLVVRRKVQVAFPVSVPVKESELDQDKHKPALVLKGFEEFDVNGVKFVRARLSIRNRHVYPDDLFRPAPDLPPCGKNENASRTWASIYSGEGRYLYGFCALSKGEDLSKLWVAFRKDQPMPDEVFVVLHDRRRNHKFTSNRVALNGKSIASDSPHYRVSSEVLESELDFTFPETLHDYIYRDMTAGSGRQGGFKIHYVEWNGIEHVYLQDEVRPERFFYLPDEFKLARVDEAMRIPWLRVEYEGQSMADLKAVISYRIARFVDFERIQAAGKELLREVDQAPEGGLVFDLLLLGPEQISYKLDYPGSVGFVERSGAALDLRYIDDTLPGMSIEDFSTVFSTLLDDDQRDPTLRGLISVKLEDLSIPPIPVAIRFGDVGGEVFEIEKKIEADRLKITLRNAIESTVAIQGVNAGVQYGEDVVAAEVMGLSFPLQIGPGEQHAFEVTPSVQIPLENAEIMLDWHDLDIHPEDTIYDLIVDGAVQTSHSKQIKKINAYVFGESAIREIELIIVDFKFSEDGPFVKSVELTPEKTTVENVDLPVPLRDYVLGQTSGRYLYRITEYSKNQEGAIEEWIGEWVAKEEDHLNITAAGLPVVPA